MDWEEEILGEMAGGYDNDRFSCYWDSDSHTTHPLVWPGSVKKPPGDLRLPALRQLE